MRHVNVTTWVMAGVLAAAVVAGAASAAPFAVKGGFDMAQRSAITRVHGCHYDDRYSYTHGWHNHSNAECRPEPARERDFVPRYEGRGGYGGHSHGGGHPCHYDCRFSPEFGWHNHSNAQCRPEPCRGR